MRNLKPGVLAEKRVSIKTDFGPLFLGYMDIYDSRGTSTKTIFDIKSKSNLNYILNEWQIADDIQLAVYAYWVFLTTKCDKIHLVHIYVLRDEEVPQVKIVENIVTLDEVLKVWDSILLTVQQMAEYHVKEIKASIEVPGNEESCFLYGKPCHYLDKCEPESPLVGLRVIKKEEETPMAEENSDDLLEQLRKRKAELKPKIPTLEKESFSILPPDAPPRTTPVTAATPTPKAEETKPKKSKVTKPTSADDSETTVYVGCTPLGKGVELYTDWVRPIESQVASKNQVAHWNMIEFHAAGIMSDAIKAELGSLPDEIVLYGNEPTAGLFLSVLRNAKVIKGF